MLYSVGQAAEQLGVAASALRYYDKEGLLPFTQRTAGGMRRFTDADMQWLRLIGCLKKTGMPLKDIKEYIKLSLQGDKTLGKRLEIFTKQQRAVNRQVTELMHTLMLINYKCWFYETAVASGTADTPRNMAEQEIPPEHREAKRLLSSI